MAKNRDKGRLPPFVPILRETMKTPAWLAMSNNAKVLYIALKGHVPKEHNIAFLSQRDARKEIGRGNNRMVGEWFEELVHYGFVVLHKPGCLGVDGEGKAPHWRLTELGTTRATSPTGISEVPTRDYLKWDGTPFQKRKPRFEKIKPRPRIGTTLPPRWHQGRPRIGISQDDNCPRVGTIREEQTCPRIGTITSKPLSLANGRHGREPEDG